MDEHSRECLAIRVKRKLNSTEVIDALTDLLILRGVPNYIRSDNGPEFIAEAVRGWVKAVGQELPTSSPDHPGKRLLRKLQRQNARPIAERQNLLLNA